MASKKSLTTRIRIYFLLIAAIPLLGFGLLVLPIIEENLTKDAFVHTEFVASHVRDTIDNFLESPIHTLTMIKQMVNRFGHDSKMVGTLMEEATQQSSILEALFLTDENRHVVHLGLTPALAPQRADFMGIDLSAHSLFRRLPRPDGTVWSDTYTSLLTGKPALSAGMPIDNLMLVANINLENLNSMLMRTLEVEKDTTVIVVDSGGVVITHSDPNKVKTQLNLHNHPAIRQALAGHEETSIYNFGNEQVLGSVLHISATGWEVFVARDMNSALELLDKTRTTLIIAILGGIILAVTAGIQSARNIIHPIQNLSEQTQMIAEGRYDLTFEKDNFIETSKLADDFSNMCAAVSEREEALRVKTDECRLIFDNSNDGISLSEVNSDDTLGNYSEVNEVLFKRLGYSRDELSAMTPIDLLSETSQQQNKDLVKQLRQNDIMLFEADQVTRNGEFVPVEVTARLVNFHNRDMVYILTRDIRDRKHAAEVIEKMAFFDSLTGLPNRHLLHDRLGQAVTNAGRDNVSLAVLFINLDRLKGINDSYGHDFGDRLLHETGRRLSMTVRGNDVVGRWGGDEFVVLLWQVAHPEHCTLVAKKILSALNEPFILDNQEVAISASVGISLFPQDAEQVDQLVTTADMAMQHAKRDGHNTYKFYSQSMNSWATERMQLENGLRFAMERNELELHYQPRVESMTLETLGVEALLRWEHPQLGKIPPDKFIPIAEETGMIRSIGEWVLRTACKQTAELHAAGFNHLRVGVNVSAQQLRNANFYQQVERALLDAGLAPEFLELELTERALVENSENTIKLFHRLRKLGTHLALDDFGVGYSSLTQLREFPLNILKIDRSFISGIPDDRNNTAITEAIMAMGVSLDMEVIAEGVENEEQYTFLAARDCNSLQGFHFSRALPITELRTFLDKHTAPQA